MLFYIWQHHSQSLVLSRPSSEFLYNEIITYSYRNLLHASNLICDGRNMPTWDGYSSKHVVPPHLGLAYVQLVAAGVPKFVMLSGLWFLYTSILLIFKQLGVFYVIWLHCILRVSQYINISQYTDNLYRIAIRNAYRNISRFFFLLNCSLFIQFLSCSNC